jgi:hypothetical protein
MQTDMLMPPATLTPALSLKGRGGPEGNEAGAKPHPHPGPLPGRQRGLSSGWALARSLGAALLLLLLAAAGPAAAALADQAGATFGLMLQDLVDTFPFVEGLVAAVEGNQVYVTLAAGDGLQTGQELTVFRKGEVFRHPMNQRPLGRFEDVLGYVQVQRVQDGYSEAVLVPIAGMPEVRPEDGVRITRGRIRVAVTPVLDLTGSAADLRRVPFMMAFGLEQSKRFQATDPSQVEDELVKSMAKIEELLVRPERLVALGKKLDIAGWLVPILMERRGTTYLDVTWISAVTGRALFSRRSELTRVEDIAEQRFPWEPILRD